MLKGISPILTPELLKIIAEMGHGDELVLADGNFPAASIGKRCVRMDGHGGAEVMAALMPLFPLDDFVDAPLCVMEVPVSSRRRTSTCPAHTWRKWSMTPSWTAHARPMRWYRPAKPPCMAISSSEKAWCGCKPPRRQTPRTARMRSGAFCMPIKAGYRSLRPLPGFGTARQSLAR